MLAGGGVVGIAWETGILRGIADASPETARLLVNSDVLIGTSAGSAVAAQISSAATLDDLFERQVDGVSAELDPGRGAVKAGELILAALAEPRTSMRQKLKHIGRVAVEADTVAAPVRRKVIAARLPAHHWPDRTLRVTAVDTTTGELVVFDRDSGAGLVDAVAASCAVPGAWPTVTIGGRRYMDGGMASALNLRVADDCEVAIAVVPAGESAAGAFGDGPAREIAAFRGRAFGVFADHASLAAFGPNLLDPGRRAAAAQAGRVQGRRVAAAVAGFLAG